MQISNRIPATVQPIDPGMIQNGENSPTAKTEAQQRGQRILTTSAAPDTVATTGAGASYPDEIRIKPAPDFKGAIDLEGLAEVEDTAELDRLDEMGRLITDVFTTPAPLMPEGIKG